MDTFPDMTEAKRRAAEATESGLGHIEPNEDAVAVAFAKAQAGRALFDHTAGRWYVWRDERWLADARHSVFNEAREFVRAARERMNEAPAAMAKIAFAAAVEKAACSDPRLAVSHEVWDRDPWLLGIPGGVVDLRSGTVSPPDPGLYLSRQTSVAPAPEGTPAPVWETFLADATGGNSEMAAFLQRLGGYVLTGAVNEEVLAFLYGPGGNGKGVFIGALAAVLAEYAVAVPIEVFTAGSRLNVEYYRAQMAGARLVTASETETQATWAESQIKELTGNEAPLSARHPYGQPFTFRPQFKLVLVGNHAPKLKGRSPAMERRLRIAPFAHRPAAPDRDLKDKLHGEHPAILRWMLDGCRAWQREGLGTAAAVKAATAAYFEQQDALRRWLDECAILDASLATKPGILLAAFNEWAKANGEDTVGNNSFAEMIDRMDGLTRTKAHGVRLVRGIGLQAATPRHDP